ncbi:branched-chain-amino-acid transaminase, partial [Sarracenia purpurea var. burkii]
WRSVWRKPECYTRGNTIKYLRVPDELNNAIEELTVQRQKLEKQRELLHAAREKILGQIEQMKKLEDLKIAPNFLNAPEIEDFDLLSS